jgi:hypothetical protein
MNVQAITDQLTISHKDAKRMAMFVVACNAKVLELSREDPGKLIVFTVASAQIAGEWIEKTHKLGWRDIFRDPFFELRQRVRRFASEWELDWEFRKAMG